MSSLSSSLSVSSWLSSKVDVTEVVGEVDDTDEDEDEDEDEEVDEIHDVHVLLESLEESPSFDPLEVGRLDISTNTGVITDTEIVCVQIRSLDARF